MTVSSEVLAARTRMFRRRRYFTWGWRAGLALAVVYGITQFFSGSSETQVSGAMYRVTRGDLPIKIVEGGSAESLEPVHIKCELRGRGMEAKILYLIEEGYRITREDIDNKRILVELDSSELEERIAEREVRYQRARAQLAEARQNLEIQRETNTTEIATAEREAKFSAMDLQKYLGEEIANELIAVLQLRRKALNAAEVARAAVMEENRLMTLAAEARKLLANAEEKSRTAKLDKASTASQVAISHATSDNGRAGGRGAEATEKSDSDVSIIVVEEQEEATSEERDVEEIQKQVKEADAAVAKAHVQTVQAISALEAAAQEAGAEFNNDPTAAVRFAMTFQPISFSEFSTDPRLGGEAMQTSSEIQKEIIMEQEEVSTARKQLDGTEKLFAKEFVSEQDLIRDQMVLKRHENLLASNEMKKELFFLYEFPKLAEEAFSLHEEALSKLDRAQKEAETKMVNSQILLQSAEAEYNEEERDRAEGIAQLEKCKIYATHEGLVVYGSGGDERYYGQEPVREGAVVRERQTILTIPDITQMAIKVNIHESDIKKVLVGQRARIQVEAFPDNVLTGRVMKVSVLPSSENRWLNPDLKIYETTIAVDGVHEWLKPGMTANVDIDVKTLEDVLYVPLQAISQWKGQRVCYLTNESRRVVETGDFNDKYIEIKSGLEEGDSIFLRSLVKDDGSETESGEEDKKKEEAPEGTGSGGEPALAKKTDEAA